MNIILTIILLYIIAVAIYTVVIKNNAMNKNNPDVNITSIILDGMKGMGIGFVITGGILMILSLFLMCIR